MEISLIITGAIVGISIYVGLSNCKRDMTALIFAALKTWNKHQKEDEEITLDGFAKEYEMARAKFRLFK